MALPGWRQTHGLLLITVVNYGCLGSWIIEVTLWDCGSDFKLTTTTPKKEKKRKNSFPFSPVSCPVCSHNNVDILSIPSHQHLSKVILIISKNGCCSLPVSDPLTQFYYKTWLKNKEALGRNTILLVKINVPKGKMKFPELQPGNQTTSATFPLHVFSQLQILLFLLSGLFSPKLSKARPLFQWRQWMH